MSEKPVTKRPVRRSLSLPGHRHRMKRQRHSFNSHQQLIWQILRRKLQHRTLLSHHHRTNSQYQCQEDPQDVALGTTLHMWMTRISDRRKMTATSLLLFGFLLKPLSLMRPYSLRSHSLRSKMRLSKAQHRRQEHMRSFSVAWLARNSLPIQCQGMAHDCCRRPPHPVKSRTSCIWGSVIVPYRGWLSGHPKNISVAHRREKNTISRF